MDSPSTSRFVDVVELDLWVIFNGGNEYLNMSNQVYLEWIFRRHQLM